MAARAKQPSVQLWWEAVLAQKRGESAAAQEAIEPYAAKYEGIYPFAVAELHAFRGEPDLAFEWLDRSFSQRNPDLMSLKYVE
jgi:serine/threonine-protein kinase